MQNAVSNKLNKSIADIFIFKPNVTEINLIKNNISKGENIFFYPSIPDASYKNLELLIITLSKLKEQDPCLLENYKLVLTVSPSYNLYVSRCYKLSESLKVNHAINWVGKLTRAEVFNYYKMSKIILFPSKLETFGFPIYEAATLSKKIICLDEPYGKDFSCFYPSVVLAKNDPLIWAQYISKIVEESDNEIRQFNYSHDWAKVIDLIYVTADRN